MLLSYLPLAPLGTATTPLVSIEGRYAKPRRGELPNEPLLEIALGVFAARAMDGDRSQLGGLRPEYRGADAAVECAGAALQRGGGDLHGGVGDDRRRREDGVRADCAQCAVHAGVERQQDQDRHDADAVFLEFAGGRNSAGLAASLRGEQAGVRDERYGAAQPCGSAADAGRCPAAKRGRNDGPSAGDGHEYRYDSQSEVGLVATTFADVAVSPVVMRKLRPAWKENGESKWELLVSATGVEQQVNALDMASAQSLFAMTLAVTVAGQDYLIESIAANEAFGQVYMYRLLLREAHQQAV